MSETDHGRRVWNEFDKAFCLSAALEGADDERIGIAVGRTAKAVRLMRERMIAGDVPAPEFAKPLVAQLAERRKAEERQTPGGRRSAATDEAAAIERYKHLRAELAQLREAIEDLLILAHVSLAVDVVAGHVPMEALTLVAPMQHSERIGRYVRQLREGRRLAGLPFGSGDDVAVGNRCRVEPGEPKAETAGEGEAPCPGAVAGAAVGDAQPCTA